MNQNNTIFASRARKGDSYDLCKNGNRTVLKDYKALKRHIIQHYKDSNYRLKSRGLTTAQHRNLENILTQ